MSNFEAIPQGVSLQGYGEILYNQPDNANGELDVEHLVFYLVISLMNAFSSLQKLNFSI